MKKIIINKARLFNACEIFICALSLFVVNFVLKRCGSVEDINDVMKFNSLLDFILFKSDVLIMILLLINIFYKNKKANLMLLYVSFGFKLIQLILIYKIENNFITQLFSSLECNFLLIMTICTSLLMLVLNIYFQNKERV